MRLSGKDVARVREVQDRLRSYVPGEPSALSWLAHAVRDVCEARSAVTYQTSVRGGRVEICAPQFVGALDSPRRTCALFTDWVRTHEHQWGAFDPIRPEAPQRNRVFATASPTAIIHGGRLPPGVHRDRTLAFLRVTVEELFRPMQWDVPQLRLLACDGPRLLAYVGLADPAGFSMRQHQLLAALARVIRDRLVLERRLEEGDVAVAAIEVALELMPVAAFVITAKGRVCFANKVGRAWLSRADADERALLESPRGPDRKTFSVMRLPGPVTTAYLVVRRSTESVELGFRVAAAAKHFGLTPRETDVLGWLARGATNQRIAAELGCAEATVEIHVSRILAKADVASRSEIVAKLFSAALS